MAEKYSADNVQALADEFIRFKRYVEDALENLDVNNFADGAWKKMVAKFGDVSSAGFEAYADAEKAIARMFAEYKKEINGDINDLQIRSSYIEAKADANSASITGLAASVGDNKTNIAMIEQNSNASGAFISLMAMSANKSIDTTKGYTINADGNYVFKDFNGNDVVLNQNEIAGIYISSINQGVKSSLTSIKLNADVVEFGNYASVDSYGNFYAKRLWGDSSGSAMIGGVTYPGFFYAEVGSGSFDHDKDRLKGADLYLKSYGGGIMYGFKQDWTKASDDYPEESYDSVNFVVGGHDVSMENVKPVWGYNYGNKTFYPKGAWDFSNCSVSNIPLYFS